MDLMTLRISFSDGNKLVCEGRLVDDTMGEIVTGPDGSWIEGRASVEFLLHEGEISHDDHGSMELKPGLYLIDERGLWMHV